MNKYIFWSVMMSAIFFNASSVFSSQFYVVGKTTFNEASTILKDKGYKITDARPLDMDWDGFMLIVFE